MAEKKFGGLFGKLSSMVFTEDYLDAQADQKENSQPAQQTSVPTANPQQNKQDYYPQPVQAPKYISVLDSNGAMAAQSQTINTDKDTQALVDKMHKLLESINKQGIDFMEFWDTLEQLGGPSLANAQNAFVALRVASKNQLTKDYLLSTAEDYRTSLKSALDKDIANSVSLKKQLTDERERKSATLRTDIANLDQQIKALQDQRAAKTTEFNQLSSGYEPRIAEIDSKIQSGQNAANIVLKEMQQIQQLIQQSIN